MKTYYVRRTGEEDYLQHWGLKSAHKYIAKLDLGGKFRYFYSQAEIEAYKAAKAAGNALNNTYKVVRKGATDAMNAANKQISTWRRKAKHAVGLYAREDMNRKWNSAASDRDPRSKAHSNKMNRWFEARKKYEKTPLGRLESAKNQAVENAQQAWYRAEKGLNKAGRDVSVAANRTVKDVKKAVGLTDRKIRDNAVAGYEAAKQKYGDRFDHSTGKDHPNVNTARTVVNKAIKNYEKTPLAKAEHLVNGVKNLSGEAGNAIERSAPVRAARGMAENAQAAIRRASDPSKPQKYGVNIIRDGKPTAAQLSSMHYKEKAARTKAKTIPSGVNPATVRSLKSSGKSYAQIAAQLGISESQVARILKR